ncbi:MAG: hypothetical protein ACREBU_22490, partial [Nitrososphaera sp.]
VHTNVEGTMSLLNPRLESLENRFPYNRPSLSALSGTWSSNTVMFIWFARIGEDIDHQNLLSNNLPGTIDITHHHNLTDRI